jgi:hypothetical protein
VPGYRLARHLDAAHPLAGTDFAVQLGVVDVCGGGTAYRTDVLHPDGSPWRVYCWRVALAGEPDYDP